VWWLRALAAAASGAPVHGVLVAGDALVCWPPMEQTTAQQTLALVLGLWQQQWHAAMPLPLPLTTALAQVNDRPAQPVYEGSGSRQGAPGEGEDAEWERFYPDFEALTADGRFEALAPLVHAPLAQWAAGELQATPHAMAALGDDDAEEDV
ncbi:MAG: hypothetical protein ACTS5V_04005, partial [Giesbergeria sp.]